jgi:hypothetical protein
MALASAILPALANTEAARASPMASRKFQTEFKNCFIGNLQIFVDDKTDVLGIQRRPLMWDNG